MIEIGYYYEKAPGHWILCTNKFKDPQKALRFMFMLKKHPKMVFMEIHGDDTYQIEWIRRKAGVDDVR